MPVSEGGVAYNTAADVGTPFLDKLNTQIDAAVANRNQLRGLAAGGVIPANDAPGPSLFGQAFGVNMDGSPVQAAPVAQAPAAPVSLAAPSLTNPAQPAASTGPGLLPIFQNAISSVESGGNYAAKGPVTGSGDRAFGKYQVMASNVGPWTKEILGQELTPQQFLANPQAQDAVFNGKFGQYLQKTGNPQDAASMWFTGRPQAQGGNASDQLGTTGNAYVAKFMAALPGSRSAQAPAPQPALAYAPGNGAAPPAVAPAASAISNAVVPAGGSAAVPTDGLPVPPSKPISAGGVAPDAPQSTADNLAPSTDAPETNTPPPFMATGRSAATGGQPAPQVAAQPQPQAQPQQAPQGIGQQNGGGPLYSSIGTPPSMDQIKALVANPATRQMGLQMWQTAVQPRGPITVKAGETILSPATGAPVYASPMAVKGGETIVNPTSGAPLYRSTGEDNSVVQIGEDAYGNHIYGQLNKATGVVTPINAAGGAGAPTFLNASNANLHGPDLLPTLPPQIAGQVKAIAEGRAQPPQGNALRSPISQQIIAAVNQYDPTFEAGNAMARNKARVDFESGPTANGITAGNTAIQHLADLAEIVPQLGNANTGIPGNNMYNQAKNAIGQSGGGAPAVNKFNTTVGDFAGELTKFYRGTGGSEADLNRVFEDLNTNKSPTQLQAGIQQQMQLVYGKVNALQDRWRQAMGPTVGDFPILSRTTQGAVNVINQMSAAHGAKQPAAAAIGASPPQAGVGLAAQTAPAVGAVMHGFRFKGGDAGSKDSWERVQ